jgi:hypothetical protein
MKLPEGAEGFRNAVLFGVVIWPAFFGIDKIKNSIAKGEAVHIGMSKVWDLDKVQSRESVLILNELKSNPTPSIEDLARPVHALGHLNQGALVGTRNRCIILVDRRPMVGHP